MDIRNFSTHAAERRRTGAILGTPPPVDGNEPACITVYDRNDLICKSISERTILDIAFSDLTSER